MAVADEYSFHELLDRTCMVGEMVDTHLLKHQLMEMNPTTKELNEIQMQLQIASDALHQAFQLIGKIHFK